MHKDSCIATGILRAIIGGSDVGIDIIVIDMIDTLTLHGLFISKKFLRYIYYIRYTMCGMGSEVSRLRIQYDTIMYVSDTIIMKGTKVLTLSAHNLEKMTTTPYHQHSYLSSSVPVSQLMHSWHALSLAMHYTAP